MEDELHALLASADALGPLEELPDVALWSEDALEPSEEAVSSSDASQRPRTQRDANIARKREYRRRKKAETEDLRAQLKRLETQLEALRIQMKASKSPETSGWKAIAQRQWKRRLEAVALNRELKTHVRLYHEVALKLTEVLPVKTDEKPSVAATISSVFEEVSLNVWDLEVMRQLRLETKDMRAEVDELLAKSKPVDLPPGSSYAAHHSWKRDETLEKGIYELSESVAMPFELTEVLAALKQAILKAYYQECKPAVMETPNDVASLAAKVHFSSSIENGSEQASPFESVFVSRAFIEEDRAVLIWKSVIRGLGCQGDWKSSVYGEFSSWGIGVQDGSGGTSMRFYNRLQLRNYRPANAGGGPEHELLRLHLERYSQLAEDDASELLWNIENEIMDSKCS